MEKHFITIFLLCFLCIKDSTLANHNNKDKGTSQNGALGIGTIGEDSTTTPDPNAPTQSTTTPSPLETGIGCGMRRVKPNSRLRIQSNNFPYNYYNRDACEWKFLATDCTLTTVCPCFDVPSSFNCLGDYLKISDGSHYTQKFCGENKPFGKYRSGSDQLTIKFKSNSRETATGFVCYVLCTPAGLADQTTPDQQVPVPPGVTCPDSVV